MQRPNLNDLAAYAAVAQERSFTRAAAKLGVSPSALSQTMRQLEERLGLRLLTRTTRSVTPTEAGERLLRGLTPMLDNIEAQLEALSDLRETPAGTIRISADESAIDWLLWPALRRVLADYPDITVEINGDARLTDIVADGYDAGVRLGGLVAKDMIAVTIGPQVEVAVIGAKEYFEGRPPPATPHDLTGHRCINLRLPTYGGLYVWEFEKDGRELRVRVEGQVIFNSITRVIQACLDGFGLAYVPKHMIKGHLDSGMLQQVLPDWSPPGPATNSIIRAGDNRRPHLTWSLRLSVIGHALLTSWRSADSTPEPELSLPSAAEGWLRLSLPAAAVAFAVEP